MARDKPQANSRELAFHWAAFITLSFSRQSQCSSPGQRNIELCLCRARKRNSDQGNFDGYNPTIGIMHEGSDGSSKFIFDLMEPERPKVDRAVLDFVKGHVFDPADFVIRSDGVCRLNPEMARMVVGRLSA
jgi:hypothetical protein